MLLSAAQFRNVNLALKSSKIPRLTPGHPLEFKYKLSPTYVLRRHTARRACVQAGAGEMRSTTQREGSLDGSRGT